MGLGKTLEVISLILASPQSADAMEHKDIDPQGKLYHTPATLGTSLMVLILILTVVCPNHLMSQWEEEIAKKTSPPLKVVAFGTKLQHAKVTYQDILDAGTFNTSLSCPLTISYRCSSDKFPILDKPELHKDRGER